MTVEGSDLDPGVEPSGRQDDLDSKLGVPVLRLSHTTRVAPQDVADGLEQKRRDSGRLGVSDKGIPIPEGPNLSEDVLDHIEHVAGVYVRDTVAHLYRQMKIEQREWFCSKIPPEGGEPLTILQQQDITREILEQFRLRARSREGDYSQFDIASVADLSKPLFTVRTRVNNKTKTDELDNSKLLEALQWMDTVDEGGTDMVTKEDAQIIWEYAGAPIGFLAQRGLLDPDDLKNLLEGARKEFPSPDAEERKIIVTRARERDQIAVEAAIIDFQTDYPDEDKVEVEVMGDQVQDFDESKIVLADTADGEIDDKDLIVDEPTMDEEEILGAKTKVLDSPSGRLINIADIASGKRPLGTVEPPKVEPEPFIDPDPTIPPHPAIVAAMPAVPPKPPERLTGRKASMEPPLDCGESTDLANSLVGVLPPEAQSQDSSERSVVLVKLRSPGSDRLDRKRVVTDDDDHSPEDLPGPITSRFNREEILGRSSQEMDALPTPAPVAPMPEPPKPSWFKRFMRFVFWLVLILAFVVLGAYMAVDTMIGDVPSRWDGQVSVASVTSLLRPPPPKPQPVVIPLKDRPLVMAAGATVDKVRERVVVTVPLRRQVERPVLMIDEQVQLSFIVERSKDESTLRYIGCESQMSGDKIQLLVLLRGPMDLDVRVIDIIPYLVD